ncbi:MAG TPA: T9SS type A sorting domain-containing protein, partial [Rhodothermales bacterium]|nr:T9SS type A sorting domain-containing protein [Rhodothermales bacterium]
VSINISTGSFTYTPNAGFTGTDSFQYRIRDPDFASSELVEVFIGVGVDTVLPVELVRFEAVQDGNSVRLSWDTASETNNAGFDVERSINGTAFESLDFIEGHGTVSEPQSYAFTDTSFPFEAQDLTYRLKQVDYDGTFDYSPEVEILVELNVPYRLTAPYPNPSTEAVHFSLVVGRAQQVEVALYDVLGRRVQVLFSGEMAAHAAQAFTVETSSLPSGQYMLRAEGVAFVETRPFVLTH